MGLHGFIRIYRRPHTNTTVLEIGFPPIKYHCARRNPSPGTVTVNGYLRIIFDGLHKQTHIFEHVVVRGGVLAYGAHIFRAQLFHRKHLKGAGQHGPRAIRRPGRVRHNNRISAINMVAAIV